MNNSNAMDFNRRSLLKGLVASGLLVAGSGIRTAAFAQTGQVLTWARPSETTLYDPQQSNLGSAWQLQHLVYEPLVTLDDDLNFVPALATAWEWQDNTLVFTLREGVKFANGREMTVDDVVGSITRVMTEVKSPWKLMLRNFESVSSPAPLTVAVAFDGPNNVALAAFSASLACILPMQEVKDGSVSLESDMFMGTGPFVVESHTANDRWVLNANPHYWQEGMPKVQQVIVRTVPATQGLIAALKDGSADIATFEANPDAPALLGGIQNVEFVTQEHTSYHVLGLNGVAEGGLFTDLRLRQAVALAVDRQQIIDFVYAGNSSSTMGFTQFKVGDDSKLPLPGKDLDRARALVKEAGAEGKSFALSYPNSDVNAAFAQIIKQQLSEIGLTANLEGLEQGVWAGRVWGSNPSQFDMTLTYFAGFANPMITAHWWAPEIAGFTAGYVPQDPTYTDALNAAVLGNDEEALQVLYNRMNEQAAMIPLCVRSETVAWRTDKVKASPSAFQTQEDLMAGIEAFEVTS